MIPIINKTIVLNYRYISGDGNIFHKSNNSLSNILSCIMYVCMCGMETLLRRNYLFDHFNYLLLFTIPLYSFITIVVMEFVWYLYDYYVILVNYIDIII